MVKKKHEDTCVRGSDHCVLISEDSGVMEAQHHFRIIIFLAAVSCGELFYGRSSGRRHPRRAAIPQGHPVNPSMTMATYRFQPFVVRYGYRCLRRWWHHPQTNNPQEFGEYYSGRTTEREAVRLQDVPAKWRTTTTSNSTNSCCEYGVVNRQLQGWRDPRCQC